MSSREGPQDDSPLVTFIVIARNEEKRIGECLEAITKASGLLPSSEIIFVDSKSTDATVEIASGYPVTVVRLGANQVASPAAGRAVGTRLARGKYILYFDGDMVLDQSWLPEVVSYMDSNPEFGAVFGRLSECRKDCAAPENEEFCPLRHEPDEPEFGIDSTDRIAGSVLIRRSVIDEVGGFNPFLPGDEEAELSYRITSSGSLIGVSSTTMAFHPRRETSTMREILRRFRFGYFYGQGLVLRIACRQGRTAFLHHLWRLKLYELHVTWTVMGILTLVMSALTRHYELAMIWGGVSTIGVVVQMTRFGPREASRRLMSSTLVGIGILSAAFRRVPNTWDFPDTSEQIK